MKRLVPLLIVLASLMGSAWSQGGDRPPPPPPPLGPMLEERLGLSEDQMQRLQPVFRQIRQTADRHREAMDAEMAAVLTPQQADRFEQMRACHEHGGPPPPPPLDGPPPRPRRGGPRPDPLGLSPAQQATLHAWMREHGPAMKAEMDAYTPQIEAVLTPEQASRFKRLRRGPHGPPPPGDDDRPGPPPNGPGDDPDPPDG